MSYGVHVNPSDVIYADFGFVYDPPFITTAVELAGTSVSPGKGGVQLRWTTGNEIGNLGFNIYRSKSDDVTTAVKINDAMMPSKALGQVVGADYEYTDTTAKQWPTYHYWLQDVGQGGSKHYLGAGSWHMPKAVRVYPARGGRPVNEEQLLA